MSILYNGSWVKPNLCFEGNKRNSFVSTEPNINLAADIVLLIGYPARIRFKSSNSENVVVHNWKLAPPAPDK